MKILNEDILKYSKHLADSPECPHTYDNLLEKIQIPELLELFLIQLLKNSKTNVSSKIKTVIESLVANIIVSAARGKLLTLKHFALAMGSIQYYGITQSY